MAKEKFNWKSLFVNEESIESVNSEVSSENTNFPTNDSSHTKFPHKKNIENSNPSPQNDIKDSVLETVVEMYQSGFDSLNVPGYDFYEFFKAIKAVNSNEPSVYKMAMTMAQLSDSNTNSKSLLKSAEFYISEINKVHMQYAKEGNQKREQLKANQHKEKDKLVSEISILEKQILELQTKISNKKIKLETSDSTLLNEILSIDQKITANDIAKTKILETIKTVADGIKKNL